MVGYLQQHQHGSFHYTTGGIDASCPSQSHSYSHGGGCLTGAPAAFDTWTIGTGAQEPTKTTRQCSTCKAQALVQWSSTHPGKTLERWQCGEALPPAALRVKVHPRRMIIAT
eukprot:m.879396 g.879396  ORF g.879396 m.879396 type:complete len:112 (+) comp23587_c1_seq80:907-1242(+)